MQRHLFEISQLRVGYDRQLLEYFFFCLDISFAAVQRALYAANSANTLSLCASLSSLPSPAIELPGDGNALGLILGGLVALIHSSPAIGLPGNGNALALTLGGLVALIVSFND